MPTPRFNLNILEVENPCPEPWDGMTGDDRVRHCRQCEKNVYHLSELTRTEAEELIVRHEGEMCVKFFRRRDGTIVTADCTALWMVKQASNAIFLTVASLLTIVLFFFTWRKLEWFQAPRNQTFSQVSVGVIRPAGWDRNE